MDLLGTHTLPPLPFKANSRADSSPSLVSRSASFNVHSDRPSNEPWGTWTTTHRKMSQDGSLTALVSSLDEEPKQLSCKVSRVG